MGEGTFLHPLTEKSYFADCRGELERLIRTVVQYFRTFKKIKDERWKRYSKRLMGLKHWGKTR